MCVHVLLYASEKRVSNNVKSLSVIDTESEVKSRKHEMQLKECQVALEERKLPLQEKQFNLERKERSTRQGHHSYRHHSLLQQCNVHIAKPKALSHVL